MEKRMPLLYIRERYVSVLGFRGGGKVFAWGMNAWAFLLMGPYEGGGEEGARASDKELVKA